MGTPIKTTDISYLHFVYERNIHFCRQYNKENTNSKITKSSLLKGLKSYVYFYEGW